MRLPALIPTGLLLCAALSCTGCSPEKFPVRTYQLGEKVTLGHLIYTVFESAWLTQIGHAPDARIPKHRFFLVRMSVVNSGGGQLISPHVTIEDDNGNTYPEMDNGEGVPQWIGYLRQVQPAQAALGNLVFDAPPAHYKLRISDEEESKFALIDIPLTFVSETPDVPVPGSAK